MLTETHLAVVRAALKFLDEEMSPSGSEALFHYLDEQGQTNGVSIHDLSVARELFEQFDLFYILFDSVSGVVNSNQLIAVPSHDKLIFESDRYVMAPVLLAIP